MTRPGLATLMATLVLAGCSGPGDDGVAAHVARGDAFLAGGKLRRARAEYEAALARAPEDGTLHLRLGRVHAAAGRYDDAIAEFRAVARRPPYAPAALAAWGDVLAARNDPAGAVRRWRAALAGTPDDDPLRARFGAALVGLGRPRKALAVLADARQPSAAVLAQLGAALEDIGRPDAARAPYRAALDADPDEPTALGRLGGLLTADPGSRAEGVALLERLVASRPADGDALGRLGRAYAAASRWPESQGVLRRALAVAADEATQQALREALAAAEAHVPRMAASASMPNVLLVIVDTLRADHVSAYGYPHPTTRNLDRLAAAGAMFEQAISHAPWTAASVATLLTAVHPSVHGLDRGPEWVGADDAGATLPYLVQRVLGPSTPTLASAFQRHGYGTAGFVSNVYLNAILGFAQGFDLYEDDAAAYAHDVMTAKQSGEETNARVFRWLAGRPREPFFLLVHYNDPHWPYDPPPAFADARVTDYRGALSPADTSFTVESEGRPIDLSPEDVGYLVALYDGEIAHADASLGALLARLGGHGLRRPLLTVVTSDHGEEFLEHGSASHGYTLFEEQLRVPLVVHQPGRVRPARITAPVRLIDVMPTILALAGLEPPPDIQGTSLLSLLEGRTSTAPGDAFSEAPLRGALRAVRTLDGLKLIEDPAQRRAMLFDLRRDPSERHNLAGGAGPADALRARVAGWAAANRAARDRLGMPSAPAGAVLDDATRRRLRALGYLD